MTNSEKVREFSELVAKSQNKELPNYAIPFSRYTTKFLIKMVLDELIELMAYSAISFSERKKILESLIENENYRPDLGFLTPSVEGQIDSLVDVEYYIKDVAARHGQNLDKVFDLIHEANMNKRNEKGLFDLRDDGKVLKPSTWKPADISSEVKRQMRGNSFEDNTLR